MHQQNFKSLQQPRIIIALYWFVLTATGFSQIPQQQETTSMQREQLLQFAREQDEKWRAERGAAEVLARQRNLPIRKKLSDGRVIELQRFENGMPIYYTTYNLTAANTISTNRVWVGGSSGLALNGTGQTLGIWDEARVRTTHQEFGGRVTQSDEATSLGQHATHVAGTMIAFGVEAAARGMASGALLQAYDWNNDISEMATAAANGLRVSNHSYGTYTGWEWDIGDDNQWYWAGDASVNMTEDYKFGFYDTTAQKMDILARNAPFYLIVRAAANDRNHTGTTGNHFDWISGQWIWQTDGHTHNADGAPNGFDTVHDGGVAKNVLTVGAVNDIPGGYNNQNNVVITNFSSFGPTDDGRIKPDIVANGDNLYSADSASDIAHVWLSGTSMAAPSVSGSIGLLWQHLRNLYGVNANFLSSTMKALIIHTADEAGLNPGPDYQFGWGLMNTSRAAEVITRDKTDDFTIQELTLNQGNTYSFTGLADGINPIKVTIVWNDPPGTPTAEVLDPTTPMLVNDLDLRVTRNSDGQIFYPWRLNRTAPLDPATRSGDNSVDNVEQVLTTLTTPDEYTITVTHKGSLQGNSQQFSMIISGIGIKINWHSDGTLVKTVSDSKVYVLENRSKRWIINDQIFNSYRFDWNKIITISSAELNIYWNGLNYNQPNVVQLFKEPNNSTVWLQQYGNILRPIKSEEVYISWGFSTQDANGDGIWDEVQVVNDVDQFGTRHENDPLLLRDGTLIKVGSTKYVIENGRARRIEYESVFNALGYQQANVMILPSLDRLKDLTFGGIDEDHPINVQTVANIGTVAYLQNANPTTTISNIGTFLQGGSATLLHWTGQDDDGISSANLYFTSNGWQNTSQINSTNLFSGGNSAQGSYSWTVPNVATNEASVRVTAYDVSGTLAYQATQTFSIAATGTPPSTPNLYDPGIYNTTGNYPIDWSDASGATSYELWEDDSPSFPSPNVITSNQSTVFLNGRSNGFYYYKVKAINNYGESAWSNMVEFEVRINFAPNVPTNPSPANNATNIALRPTLNWQGGDPNGESVIYRVMWSTLPDPQGQTGGDLTTTSYTFDYDLIPNTQYYWRIWCRDAAGQVTLGPIWTLTTAYIFPDLAIQSATLDNTTPQIGATIQATTTIKNIGNLDAFQTQVKYYFSKIAGAKETLLLSNNNLQALTVGQQVTIQDNLIIPPQGTGPAFIDIVVNPANSPVEAVLSNNISSPAITVGDNTAPQVTLHEPPFNNLVYRTGFPVRIVWTATDNFGIDSYDIFYSLDDGVNWTPLEQNYHPTINSYNWTPPANAVTSTARIKLGVRDLATNATTVTGNPFTIVDGTGTTVTVTSPNGGESWPLGSTQQITWTASSPNQITGIEIWKIFDGVRDFITGFSGNSGSYSWTLPPAGATNNALIQIIVQDQYGTRVEDVSNGYFSLTDPDAPPPAPWHLPESVTSDQGTTIKNYPDIAVDHLNNVHLIYSMTGQIYYRKRTGSTWSGPTQVTNFAAGQFDFVQDLKIAIDQSNNPHIIWIAGKSPNPNNDDNLYYSFFTGASWSAPENLSAEVTTGSDSRTQYPAVTTDSNGKVHVVWTERVFPGTASYMYHKMKNGSTWQSASQISMPVKDWPDMAGDAAGNIHLVTASDAPSVYYGFYNGSGWTFSPITTSLTDYNQETRIAVDSNNKPHVIWYNLVYNTQIGAYEDSKIYYSYFNGTAWSQPEVGATYKSSSYSRFISLALNSANAPQLFWIEEDKSTNPALDMLFTRQKNNGIWSPNTRLSTRAGNVRGDVSASSNGNNVSVVYAAFYQGGRQIMHNYAQVSQDVIPPTVSVLTPAPNQALALGSTFNITWNAQDDIGVVSVTLKYSVDGGANFSTIASGEANDGSYTWTVGNALTESAKILIQAFDAQGNIGSGYSSLFRIVDVTNPSVSVTAPNGGEQWDVGSTQNITWSATDNVAVQAVDLSYSIDNGATYTPIASNEANDGTYAWTVPDAPTLNAFVKVVARDASSNAGSDVSNAAFRIKRANTAPSAANSPFPIHQATNVSTTVTLSWEAADVDGDPLIYDVYLSTSSNPTTRVSDNQTGKSYVASSLSTNRAYYWKIVVSDGQVETSGPIWQFTTGSAQVNPPTNLAASLSTPTSVQLSWVDNSINENQFIIEVKTSGNFSQLGTTVQNATTFSAQNLQPNTPYTFRVYATTGTANSSFSNESGITTGNTGPLLPSNPSPGHNASGQATNLTLSWTGGDPDAGDVVKYYVYFGTSTAPALFDSVVSNTTFAVSNLNYNTFYFWKIIAKDLQGEETTGPVWNFSTTSAPVPSAPTNLTANVINGRQVDLTWTDNASNELGYKIERKKSSDANFSQVAVAPTNAVNYSDATGLIGNTSYQYRLRAYNASGNSAYSSEAVAVTPNNAPSRPANLEPGDTQIAISVTPTLISSAFLDTDANDGHGATQWQVTASAGNYGTPVFDSGADVNNKTSITLSSGVLTANTTYWWRVRHRDNYNVWSDYSVETSFTTGASNHDVSGTISYYQANRAVSGATVSATHTSGTTNANTSTTGDYLLSALPDGNVTLTPAKTGDLRAAITGTDALTCLRYLAFLVTLTPDQQKAADVNKSGGVTPADATAILNYLAFYSTGIGNTSEWIFDPTSSTFSLSANADVDFKAYLLGDVNGNWGSTSNPSSVVMKANDGEAPWQIKWSALETTNDGLLKIPLRFEAIQQEANTILLTVEYDADLLEYRNVASATATGKFMLVANGSIPGKVHLAMAGIDGVKEKGEFVSFLFAPKSNTESGSASTEFMLDHLVINDAELPVKEKLTVATDELALPREFSLSQNYPNPFNPETTIRFAVPAKYSEGVRVQVRIYNLQGQLVTTLVDERKTPGRYKVVWNSKNSFNQPVTSSLYFYVMTAGDFRSVKKMIIVR